MKSYVVGGNYILLASASIPFYWMLYPIVVEMFGFLQALAWMTLVTAALCLLGFFLRMRSGKDWFALAYFRRKERRLWRLRGNFFKEAVSFFVRRFQPAFFLGLSCLVNPVVATVYVSEPEYYGPLRGRQWWLFCLSLAVNTLYHTSFAFGLVKTASLLRALLSGA